MDEKIKKTSHRIMIAGEPQRLTKRAGVFYWQKTIYSGCKSTQMKHPHFCVLSAFFRIIKAIERTTADSMT
ncbi:hypothetical protein B5G50_17255 [Brevibacillus brevis]|uniref:hypothetical protein n=1 Tax=Brevibacillus brevis TaxID=1393 RepID=UPI000B38F8BD|nr:hypothetical protein [Brevibacillus brevis]OUQ87286.1 hypothetical protein B5G50_17255 [Brevibacillus brevis]